MLKALNNFGFFLLNFALAHYGRWFFCGLTQARNSLGSWTDLSKRWWRESVCMCVCERERERERKMFLLQDERITQHLLSQRYAPLHSIMSLSLSLSLSQHTHSLSQHTHTHSLSLSVSLFLSLSLSAIEHILRISRRLDVSGSISYVKHFLKNFFCLMITKMVLDTVDV